MTLLPQLERELLAAHARHVHGRRRDLVSRVFGAGGVILATAVAVAVAAVVILAVRHSHPVSARGGPPSLPPAATGPLLPSNPTSRQRRDESYLYKALAAVTRRDRACSLVSSALTHRATISQGSPSQALLSILGVLRRPAQASDRLPVRITYNPYRRDPAGSLPPLKGVYVRYIRRARVRYDAGYYLIPAADANALHPIPERCYAELHAAVGHELDHVSTNLRAGARKLEPRFVNQLRSQTTPAEGVCLAALNDTGNGDGCGGGYTVADIEQGHTIASGGPTGVGVVYGIVPDGVTAVTLRYRTQSFTVTVINNVFILKNPHQHLPNYGFPKTIIWRGTNNTTIKTITDR
jgi:hypothetical protein